MTDKPDTSPEALRREIMKWLDRGNSHVAALLEALAAEKVDLVRERDALRRFCAPDADPDDPLVTKLNIYNSVAEWMAVGYRLHAAGVITAKLTSAEERAEKAEAAAAAMREALQSIAQKGPCFDAKGTRSKEVNDIARSALSSTAGTDLRARMERLQRTLEKYGSHDDRCEKNPKHGIRNGRCDCGFEEALADQQGENPSPASATSRDS